MPKEYPAKFKTEVIQPYRDGESIRSLSQELRIAHRAKHDLSLAERVLLYQSSKSHLYCERI